MPPRAPKKKQNVQMILPTDPEPSISSESSVEIKPKKQKPLTKKEVGKMKKMEKEMKEKLVLMKKEAEDMLADYQAMENASLLKAQQEEEQQLLRVELLTGTCQTFETAKLRLIHELNKIREEEIWKRYITTDQKPYPESITNMHNHLYLWQQQKITENMDFALKNCDTYLETLDLLNELIEYPLYSTKETLANWKELRTEWRSEFLERIDKCCFHMIKNLSKNFEQQVEQKHVYAFDFETNHLKLGMSAWTENNNTPPSLRLSPKITFTTSDAEFVMPVEYRHKPFILRLVYLDRDFVSDNSLTSSPPPSLPMEQDLLKEITRCFEAKKEAKMSVADREREKVKAAKQKYLEAQEAANQVEKSFKTLQEQTKEFRAKKLSKESIKSEGDGYEALAGERRRKRQTQSLGRLHEAAAETPSSTKRRAAPDTFGEPSSNARILMQTAGAMKTLDAISMRSGMRKRPEKVRKPTTQEDTGHPSNVFKTRSMTSVKELRTRTQIRRDSALCFEELELSSDESLAAHKVESYDSLDLMLGKEKKEDLLGGTITTLRQLIEETVIVERDPKQRLTSKTVSSTNSVDWKKRRGRGKSVVSLDKKLTGHADPDEIPQSASEIFDSKEDARQEQYLTSMYFQTIPKRLYHFNLRMYNIVSGMYLLDLISHVSQPRQLPNGTSVQIFYGEMNINREKYQYKYVPPPPPQPEDDPHELPPDQGLQHLLHVKIPLPKNVVYFEPPQVALWDRDEQFWTNEHVHKLEINRENHMATFSLSRIMPFAFCLKKFSLLPYVSWTLKPKFDSGGVSLTIKSAFATVEFHVLHFNVSLTKAVNCGDENIAQVRDIIGKEMQLHKLIAVMKSRGVNVFPDEDTCLYIENSAKDVLLEEHTNLCMAMWSDNLEFQGCEWNGDFKRRKLAFRVRESLPYNLELRYRTIVACCLSATIYRLGTDEASFNESKLESYGFCPDVLTLLEKAFIHVAPSNPVNPLQVLCVYSLLCRTKVLSYCGISRKETLSSSSDESKGVKKRPKKQVKQKCRMTTAKSSREGSLLISENSSSLLL